MGRGGSKGEREKTPQLWEKKVLETPLMVSSHDLFLLDLSAAFGTDGNFFLLELYSSLGFEDSTLSWFPSYLTSCSLFTSFAGLSSSPWPLAQFLVLPCPVLTYSLGDLTHSHDFIFYLYTDNSIFIILDQVSHITMSLSTSPHMLWDISNMPKVKLQILSHSCHAHLHSFPHPNKWRLHLLVDQPKKLSVILDFFFSHTPHLI